MAAPRLTHPNPTRVAAVIMFALVAAACSSGTGSKQDSQSDPAAAAAAALKTSTTSTVATTTSAPSSTSTQPVHPLGSTASPGEVVNQYSLEVGDCFNQRRELRSGLPVVTTTRVECNSPHEFEVFHRLDFPVGFPALHPGDKVMRDFALESCYRAFDAWVGEIYELSSLEIEVITPTQDNFEDPVARYRGIHCLAHLSDGSLLTETTEGSGL